MSEETTDFQINVKADSDKNNQVTVSFNGSLGISNAFKIKNELEQIEVKGAKYILKFEYLDEIDLSFIQIIIAWTKNITAGKKEVTYQWNVSDDLMQLVQHGGFRQILQI